MNLKLTHVAGIDASYESDEPEQMPGAFAIFEYTDLKNPANGKITVSVDVMADGTIVLTGNQEASTCGNEFEPVQVRRVFSVSDLLGAEVNMGDTETLTLYEDAPVYSLGLQDQESSATTDEPSIQTIFNC